MFKKYKKNSEPTVKKKKEIITINKIGNFLSLYLSSAESQQKDISDSTEMNYCTMDVIVKDHTFFLYFKFIFQRVRIKYNK